MDKKHLGVEFYRNFVGIEKPLRVGSTSIKEHVELFDFCHKQGIITKTAHNKQFLHDYDKFKPYLRTIEDLSDEELIYIFTGQAIITHIGKYKYSIKRTETYIHLKRWEKDGYYENSFHLIDMKFRECDEEILNRLYSTNSHPKAKEYIDNGLALRVEK